VVSSWAGVLHCPPLHQSIISSFTKAASSIWIIVEAFPIWIKIFAEPCVVGSLCASPLPPVRVQNHLASRRNTYCVQLKRFCEQLPTIFLHFF
jgi:hypothetical protein